MGIGSTKYSCVYVYNYVGTGRWYVSFAVINSFEFDHCQVLKIKFKGECCGDMILPHAAAKE